MCRSPKWRHALSLLNVRLFSGSQGKSWKSKELKRNVRRDESSEWEHENECECIECVEPYATYGGPTEWFQCNKCHIWVWVCALDCAIFMCLAISTPVTTLMTSHLNTEVILVTKMILGTCLT
jgi:hypothetical protein